MIEEINDIIEWYTKLGSGYNNVNELMYQRTRLAGLYTHFCSVLGEYRTAWNEAQATRENERAKIEFKEVQKGTSGNKATLIAKSNTYTHLALEKQLEGKYYKAKYESESIKEVLNAMHQHIAQARDEWRLQKFINQSNA